MADSLGDIMSKRQWEESPEVQVIKDFVFEKFEATPRITVQEKFIVIQVPSAALAGALRSHVYQLQQLCRTEKRLVIRIGR